jgi:Bifunctional DNA primase/polymerase, N-terminal
MVDSATPQINKSPDASTGSTQNEEQNSYSTFITEVEAIKRASHVALQRKNVALYRSLGFCCIPLEYGTKKKPRVKWTENPLNVGVVLGAVSNNLIMIDIDGPAAQQVFSKGLVDIGYGNLRTTLVNTAMTRSGSHRGYHFLLRVSDEVLNDKQAGEFYRHLLFGKAKRELWTGSGKHEEIALLSTGGMAILSPSLHPDGGWYAWNGRQPQTLSTKEEVEDLLGMFGFDLAKERQDRRRKHRRNQQILKRNAGISPLSSLVDSYDDAESSDPAPVGVVHKATMESYRLISKREKMNWLDALAKRDRYRLGNRHKVILDLAGALRKSGYTQESVLDFVEEICDYFSDEERDDRRRAVLTTWERPIDQVKGWSGLNEID